MLHEDPNQTDVKAFLDKPAPSWDSPLCKKGNYPDLFYCISVGRDEERGFLPSCRSVGEARPRTPAPGAAWEFLETDVCSALTSGPQLQPPHPCRLPDLAVQHPVCASISSRSSQNHHDRETAIPHGLARHQILNTSKDL